MYCYIVILLAAAAHASEHVFSVQDDVLAYPQFAVEYSESYISRDEARRRLDQQERWYSEASDHGEPVQTELTTYDASSGHTSSEHDIANESPEFYELMKFGSQQYLCSVPFLESSSKNESSQPLSEAEQQKELVRATDRGWELLQDLEGKCMYYVSGWWSYSFCYNAQIKQFHQLPPGGVVPIYPPQEDPTTPSYVLGRFKDVRTHETSETPSTQKDLTELKVQGETRYLVQKLGGGTTCDLTGKDRKVEVQFHCHPQSTDRIGYIKEVTTCTYLMVIYTPRLCNDVAFLPPREDRPHTISCREILSADEIAQRGLKHAGDLKKNYIDGLGNERKVVGNIQVGAKQLVGGDGRRIEKGRVVTPPEERADVIAKKERGEIRALSKDDMKKMEIDPETIEAFSKELEEMAGDKDWKLEVVDEVNGVRRIRGIVEGDSQSSESSKGGSQQPSEDEDREGSEEEYKDEL